MTAPDVDVPDDVVLPVPHGWTRSEDVPHALAAFVAEYRAGVFTPNIVLTVHGLEPGETAAGWIDRTLPTLAAEVPLLHVVDSGGTEVAGGPGHHLLVHYPLSEFGGVTVEQWLTVVGGRGLVLACSVATLEYDDAADVFAEVAAGLAVGGPTVDGPTVDGPAVDGGATR